MPSIDEVTAFRRASESFVQRARAIGPDQWSGSTPCTEWDVRMLVNHVAGEYLWVPEMLAGRTIAEVGDRLHIAYRFQGVEDGQPYLVEQQLYCTLGEEGIESADLLCSGSRPLPAL